MRFLSRLFPSNRVPGDLATRMGMAAEVLTVTAGDTLVITSERMITAEQREKIAAYVKRGAPDGVKVMVLDGSLRLSVVRQGAIPHIPMPKP